MDKRILRRMRKTKRKESLIIRTEVWEKKKNCLKWKRQWTGGLKKRKLVKIEEDTRNQSINAENKERKWEIKKKEIDK